MPWAGSPTSLQFPWSTDMNIWACNAMNCNGAHFPHAFLIVNSNSISLGTISTQKQNLAKPTHASFPNIEILTRRICHSRLSLDSPGTCHCIRHHSAGSGHFLTPAPAPLPAAPAR